MADVAKDQGKKINAAAIEKKLGIPVALISANDRKSYEKFYAVSTSIAFNRDTFRVNNGTHYAYAVQNLFRQVKKVRLLLFTMLQL